MPSGSFIQRSCPGGCILGQSINRPNPAEQDKTNQGYIFRIKFVANAI